MKNQLRNLISYLFIISVVISLFSCKGMYDNIEPYSEEIIYPAKYDTIISKIGYNRVELDLMKAGRIPTSQIFMGKASKTVIEYDDVQITIDSLVSWVNITGLDQPKLYRINVYTIDEYNNKSVSQEIAVIPFTDIDINNLVIASPRILTSPNSVVIDWTSSLSSILLDYRSIEFKYKDKNNVEITGVRTANPRIFAANLSAGEPFTIQINYNVIPRINNIPILDSVKLEKSLIINMPTSSTSFNPVERDILEANGVTTFTADGVASVKKLTFPIHTNTLQDLFYFPNIEELDLTGGNLFDLTTLSYNRNGVVKTIGGGNYLPFIRKVSPITDANAQTLVDLLNLGVIKKIKYSPNSLGIDHLLKPFDGKGIIEYVSIPTESLIPMNFFIDGKIQDNAWALDIVNPATDYPSGTGILNPFKTTIRAKNGSFVFTIPKEYRFNLADYRYLKFKVYSPNKSNFEGIYSPYQRLWPRFMNYLWAFSSESSFGQESWDTDPNNYKISDQNLQKWTDVSIDLSSMENKHTRVIVINIGGEPSLTYNPPADIIYYFSNFRFAK